MNRGLATTFNINEIEEMVINDCKAGLERAVSLAVSEGSTLHIIHAWLLYGERILKNRIPRDELDAMLDETKMLPGWSWRTITSHL